MKKIMLFIFIYTLSIYAYSIENVDDKKIKTCMFKIDGKLTNDSFNMHNGATYDHCNADDLIFITGALVPLLCNFNKPIILNSYKNAAHCFYRGEPRQESSYH